MKYLDVLQTEAEDEFGVVRKGYEKWAYSWKKVIPDTMEEIEAKNKIPKAISDLKVLISTENSDATKWKIEEVVAHLKEIERILNVR